MVLVGCSKPVRIEFVGEIPLRLSSLDPIALPATVVRDGDGKKMAKETATVTLDPPGLAELSDGQLIPRARGDLTIRWTASNGINVERHLEIRPIDQIKLRCTPVCRGTVGDVLTVSATAYSGETLLDFDVPLEVSDAAVLQMEGHKVRLIASGTASVHARVPGAATVSVAVEVRGKPDAVDVICPTITTKTTVSDDEEIDVCYVTKWGGLRFEAFALGQGKRMPDERVRFDVLNTRIADVSVDGVVTPVAIGQTVLKVSSSSNPFLSKQMSLYVDEPRALSRLRRMMRRPLGRYYSANSGRTYAFYAPACRDWHGFALKAYARVPDRPEAQEIMCETSEAVSCAAEASRGLTRIGRSSAEAMRAWLGPCCCLTAEDKAFLLEDEREPGGKK